MSDPIHRFWPINDRPESDENDIGRLPQVFVKDGEELTVRLVPPVFCDLVEGWPGVMLCEHVWGIWPSQARAVCPVKTHGPLLEREVPKSCAACAARVELRETLLIHGAVEGHKKLRGAAVAFGFRDFETVQRLWDGGLIGFERGKMLRLWREYGRLEYQALEDDPVDKKAYLVEGEFWHLRMRSISTQRLEDMAAAVEGWIKAGEPIKPGGNVEDLINLLPEARLVPMPFGFKGPVREGWNNISLAKMRDPDYLRLLSAGNMGMLCGLCLESKRAIIGLDADSDGFADELEQLNPWLSRTFCVRGRRGRKWFFSIFGDARVMESVSQSTKIKRGIRDVGDWLGAKKQGVISGLHPSGCWYEHNSKPMLEIKPDNFTLPDDCEFAKNVRVEPVFLGRFRRWERHFATPSATIDEALDFISPEERSDWFTVGCALKSWGEENGDDEAARKLWDRWSRQSRKFDSAGQQKLWDSLGRDRGKKITLGSLFHLACEAGWEKGERDDE